ncbi:MAG TPA: S41 family peptidase [Trueperaceae bacterium]
MRRGRGRPRRAGVAGAALLALALACAAGAQPPAEGPPPVSEGVPPAPAGEELAVARAPEGRELRRMVFEATVDLFEDYYWDESRLDWEAWAARYRQDALNAERRARFDNVMRRMVAEVGDDHSRWLGLEGLEPGLAPITAPFDPAGAAPLLGAGGAAVGSPGDGVTVAVASWGLASPRAGLGGPAPWRDALAQDEPTPSLGLLVRWVSGAGVVVERVLPGTPADEAGVRRGDVIVAVQGRSLEKAGAAGVGLVLSASVGEERVDLRLLRAGREEIEVSLEPRYLAHAELQRTPAAELLDDGVGYIYLPSFTLAGTGARAHELLADLRERGARSYVIDLRGNRGGSLAELGVLMGAFVDGDWARAVARGRVVWTASFARRSGGDAGVAVLRAEDGRLLRAAAVESPVFVTEPLVVLVDDDTSSAAEVAAAVLQATGRARVVGTPTSGNVEVVRTYLLPDRSQVLLAVANLELTDGRPLDAGIVPDADATVDDRELARGYDAPLAEGVRLLAGLPFVPGRWF